MVACRCQRLPAAARNAHMHGYGGALFPMDSARSGRETAPQCSREIHETGDVATAQWRYFQASGTRAWLPRRCWQKNCIAIGLSAGFLAPLESTGIYLIQRSIFVVLKFFPTAISGSRALITATGSSRSTRSAGQAS